jgi:hypothetical protein
MLHLKTETLNNRHTPEFTITDNAMHPQKTAYPSPLTLDRLQMPGRDPSIEFYITPEKALLCAVLERAIRDGLRTGIDGVKLCERVRARRWFLHREPPDLMRPWTFDWVCHCLGISSAFKRMLVSRARALASRELRESGVIPDLANYQPGQINRCH